ncbi:class I SAM-dependent methyltransferase [Xanthomonas medicagonis]|uniref:class I SAM-dependent methyltransferase n=1 Tax=Xanthomonas medicagonis TaxID=3160841 RepID=UPI003515E295
MSQRTPFPFADPAAFACYAAEAPRKVPGLADLHRMAMLLLAEHAAAAAQVLVVGAGGGLELAALAQAQPGWRFTGVDPSPAMLALARQVASSYAGRIALLEGTVDEAPDGPFAGATCLLTLHFLDRAERLRTLQAIRRRLAPSARLVIAHHAAAGRDPRQWLARSAAFGERRGVDWGKAMDSGGSLAARLPLLAPAEEEALLEEAGFVDVALFYAAFSFRGWVASVPA